MTIEVGSGLSKEEVERMASDAEAHADDDSKAKIESSIADLKKAMEGEDADALKAQIATFEQAYQEAGAAMAGAAPGADGAAAADAAPEAEAGAGASATQDDDIKDADFEVK